MNCILPHPRTEANVDLWAATHGVDYEELLPYELSNRGMYVLFLELLELYCMGIPFHGDF